MKKENVKLLHYIVIKFFTCIKENDDKYEQDLLNKTQILLACDVRLIIIYYKNGCLIFEKYRNVYINKIWSNKFKI